MGVAGLAGVDGPEARAALQQTSLLRDRAPCLMFGDQTSHAHAQQCCGDELRVEGDRLASDTGFAESMPHSMRSLAVIKMTTECSL